MNHKIWTHPFSLQELNERYKNSFCAHLGIEFVEMTDESLTARMPITKAHLQPYGIMHGGASASLAETVASVAASYCVGADKACVGIELNINHLKAVRDGHIDAIAKPLHIGKTTQVWEIKIFKTGNALVSAARLTLSVINKN